MNRGTILHACISKSKGPAKDAVPRAILREDHGLEGDAHAGPWHRQVSLLSATDIEGMRAKGLDLEPGAFGENLVVGGLDLDAIGIGTLLRAGEAELEVTQIGKVCHSPCRIYHRVGDCIMPRAGLFARVLKGGEVAPGASIEVISEVPRGVFQAAVLTVSDRCAAGAAEDTAGPAVADLLRRQIGAHIAWTGVVSDDTDTISTTVKEIADRNIDLLVTGPLVKPKISSVGTAKAIAADYGKYTLLGPLGLLVPTGRSKKHPCVGSLQEYRQQQAAED